MPARSSYRSSVCVINLPPRSLHRCLICGRPLQPSVTGRRRLTCSPACRQKRYRIRRQARRFEALELARANRRADRQLAALERRFGPFSDQPPAPGRASPRRRIRWSLSRGFSLDPCVECGRPMLDSGPGRRYCSGSCRYRAFTRRRAVRDALYKRRILPDRRVYRLLGKRQYFPVCAHCRIPFVRATPRGRPPRYCSKKCRDAAFWRRCHRPVVRRAICPGCGGRFSARRPLQRFCARLCADRARRRARYVGRTGANVVDRCIVCGAAFEPPPVRQGRVDRRYCSLRCRLVASRRRRKQRLAAVLGSQKRRCAWCGQALSWEARASRRYCSDRCASHRANQRRRLAPPVPSPGLIPVCA